MHCEKICGAAESTVLSGFDQWHVNKLDSVVARLAKLGEDSSPNSRQFQARKKKQQVD